jgi:RNA polymerase sigma-70 factor (ECF subfamily)
VRNAGADPRIERFQRGEEAALESLYDEHADFVFSLALRILGDRNEAEDVLQEVWIQAWRERERFRPEQSAFAAWIAMIARSRSLDRVRRRATRVRKEDEIGRDDPLPLETPAGEATLVAERLRVAVASLDPRYRKALELAYWGGLSHAKISEALGEPLGTVKTWVRTGLLQLRDRVSEERTS